MEGHNLSINSLSQWEQFMELGKDMADSVIEEKMKAQRPEQCALLIYTVSNYKYLSSQNYTSSSFVYIQSGTTGKPKGVMLSHDNVSCSKIHLLHPIKSR